MKKAINGKSTLQPGDGHMGIIKRDQGDQSISSTVSATNHKAKGNSETPHTAKGKEHSLGEGSTMLRMLLNWWTTSIMSLQKNKFLQQIHFAPFPLLPP